MLYLPDYLVLALAKVQVDNGLGRSFAGLLAVTEGTYKLGALPIEQYAELTERYSTKLLDRPKKEATPVKATVTRTLKQIKKRSELEELESQNSRVLDQWATMKEKSKLYYVEKAKKDLAEHPELENAKLIAALGDGLNDS